jgi:precorrin-2 dehydrogenase/sirohydrochlorin ferrochelatase
MSLFPIFLKLQDKSAIVVGGGTIAESKIPGLMEAGAKVRVIAPAINKKIAEWVREARLEWSQKAFASGDLQGASLVIAATSASGVNKAVFLEAEARGIWCNSVDDVDNCHFYYGAVVQRGDLQIAISTNGKSPAFAQRLRKELETQYGPEYEIWLEWLGAARESLRAAQEKGEATKHLLHHLASRPMFERFLKEAHQQPAGRGVV